MVFIVEMAWGRPHEIVFYGFDAEGELVPSHVVPTGAPRDPDRREFSCHAQVWEQALELGRSAGWEPQGTIPAPSSREAWSKFGRLENSYVPDEWQYAKQFQTDDAVNLADALQRVLSSGVGGESRSENPMPVLLRDGMTPNDQRTRCRYCYVTG
jgi:hypothetical protein